MKFKFDSTLNTAFLNSEINKMPFAKGTKVNRKIVHKYTRMYCHSI